MPVKPTTYLPSKRPSPIKRKPSATVNKKPGLDLMDKFLIKAVKFGLFSMFGLFVIAQLKNKNTAINSLSNAPIAKPKAP